MIKIKNSDGTFKDDIPMLDLHGERHEDVDRIVENFILNTLGTKRIITGNSHRMKELTNNVLRRHKIPAIRLGGNAGVLVVTDPKETKESVKRGSEFIPEQVKIRRNRK